MLALDAAGVSYIGAGGGLAIGRRGRGGAGRGLGYQRHRGDHSMPEDDHNPVSGIRSLLYAGQKHQHCQAGL